MTNFLINFIQFFNNYTISITAESLQIIEEMQPNYLGWLSPISHPPEVCYHWLQVLEKIKELNWITEAWLCGMIKLGY